MSNPVGNPLTITFRRTTLTPEQQKQFAQLVDIIRRFLERHARGPFVAHFDGKGSFDVVNVQLTEKYALADQPTDGFEVSNGQRG